MSPYKRFYVENVIPALMERFGYKNVMQVPRLEKICINMGLGKAQQDQNIIDEAVSELTLIAGQRPVLTRAKKSVAAFRVRKGNIVGCKVTLRDVRMYEFLNKLINVALP
ncbi:TPA: 50S ribosomal protein L5, partial [Candidatus Poribacteria bacterium]|nr:50S ribosomal protein L5 [Candidatus Poribacteria bacterium]